MAMTTSNGLALGMQAPNFDLPATDGRNYTLADFDEARVLVVIFTCNHCPVAKAVEDRFVALQADYERRGVRLVAINANDSENYPADSFAEMVNRAQEKSFNFPYLHDASQAVAQAYGAKCTPDIYAFSADHTLAYQGRLDDNWKDASAVQQQDLRRVIDALLAEQPIDFDVHPAVGCSIKWKS